MPIQTPQGPPKITAVHSGGIVVHMAPVKGVPNELTLHIIRDGKTETHFSIEELRAVLNTINQQLASAHTRALTTKAE